MNVMWAHVDSDGWIVRWGVSVGSDVFLQLLPSGQTAVSRPEQVHGYDLDGQRWRLVGDAWSLEDVDA